MILTMIWRTIVQQFNQVNHQKSIKIILLQRSRKQQENRRQEEEYQLLNFLIIPIISC